jgi:hypothetical protein
MSTPLLTAPLFLIILFNLRRLRTEYITPDDMFWLLIYLFFVIHPIQDISNGVIGSEGPAGARQYSSYEITYAMIIVLAFVIAFSFGRSFYASFFDRSKLHDEKSNAPHAGWIVAFVVINVISFFGYLFSYGVENVFAARNDQNFDNVYIFALGLFGLQNASAFFLCSFYKNAPKTGTWFLSALAMMGALVLLFISQNPFNTPRYFLIEAWGPVALILTRGKIRALPFYLVCLLGLTVVLPILSVTTRIGIAEYNELTEALSIDTFFSIPFIDVFDTLVHAVQFMQGHSWFYGAKLLAIVLFFVPRTVWPGKPIVGGLDVGGELVAIGSSGTDNLSFFIAGDFYMDLGVPAVIIGGAACGFLLAKIQNVRFGRLYGENLMAYILISSLPILMRGPVGSVAPLFVCQVFALWLCRRAFSGDRAVRPSGAVGTYPFGRS